MSLTRWTRACLLLWLLSSGVALATPLVDGTQAARVENERGERLYKSGQYQEAIRAFRAAYLQKPSPVLLYNIAQCHRLLQQHQQAVTIYERALKEGLSADLRSKAEAWREQEQQEVRQRAAVEAEAHRRQEDSLRSADAGKPVYRKPWFWVVVTGVAAAAATGITLGVYFGVPPRDRLTDLGTFPAY